MACTSVPAAKFADSKPTSAVEREVWAFAKLAVNTANTVILKMFPLNFLIAGFISFPKISGLFLLFDDPSNVLEGQH
jgi:hypothetical protein